MARSWGQSSFLTVPICTEGAGRSPTAEFKSIIPSKAVVGCVQGSFHPEGQLGSA